MPKPGSIFPDVGLVSTSDLKKTLLLTGKQQGTDMRKVQQQTERGLEARIPHWRTQGSWHPPPLITAPQLEWRGLGSRDWRALWKPSSATLWGMPSRRGRRRALKCIWIWNFERIVLSLKKKNKREYFNKWNGLTIMEKAEILLIAPPSKLSTKKKKYS